MRTIYVYIMADSKRQLRVGYTDDIRRDLGVYGTVKKVYPERLVYYETLSNVQDAVDRYMELGHLKRPAQVALVAAFNPQWEDLRAVWQ